LGRAEQAPAMLVPPRPGVAFPEGYLQFRRDNPFSFRLDGGLSRWVERAKAQRVAAALQPESGFGGGAVTGTVRVPVVPIAFTPATAPAPPSPAVIDNVLFSAASGTVTDYYDEVSYGLLDLTGDVFGYTTVASSAAYYGNGVYGVGAGGRVWDLLRDTLTLADGTIDFSPYDNDGPDGIPNSGDDDGVVDLVAFLQPIVGAECDTLLTNNIWSHRFLYSGWASNGPKLPFTTNDASANGGFLKIDDYTLQSAVNCAGAPLEIGTFAHEVGHIFGLPDLYDTDGGSQGLGDWSLMASGCWNSQSSPAHMSAWEKSELGWLTPILLTDPNPSAQTVIPEVETNPIAYQVVVGNGEYFLVENRQPTGFDQHLHGCGLAIYHVDEATILARTQSNTVNNFQNCGAFVQQPQAHYGIALEQADGLCQLEANVSRGDASDPFPGSLNKTTFDSTTTPNTNSYKGPTNVSFENISGCGALMTARIEALPLPPVQSGGVDVMFVIDNTGSYADDYPVIAAQMVDIVGALTSQFSNIKFGLSIFRDFPYSPFGGASDEPYELRQALTSSTATFLAAVTDLTTNHSPGGGADIPESQYEAVFQTLQGLGRDLDGDTILEPLVPGEILPSTTGWGLGRHRVVYLLTDAPFHDSETENNYPTAIGESIGRNALRSVVASYPPDKLTMFVMVAGYPNAFIVPGQDGGLPSVPASTLFNQSQELAVLTGGGVYMIGRDSAGLEEAIDISITVLENSDIVPPAEVSTYCTPGSSTNGCVPTISAVGVPSAAQSSGFMIDATGLEGQKVALHFYGLSGQVATPWGAGSSVLCVKPPHQRMASLSTGGTAGQCDGSVSIDWLAFLSTNPSALGNPLTAGTVVNAQVWYRDPPAAKTTNLTGGLEFSIAP
jgi:M6 family metalloprotease-like protein